MHSYGPNPAPRHTSERPTGEQPPDPATGLRVFAWIFGVWFALTIIGLVAWIILRDA